MKREKARRRTCTLCHLYLVSPCVTLALLLLILPVLICLNLLFLFFFFLGGGYLYISMVLLNI